MSKKRNQMLKDALILIGVSKMTKKELAEWFNVSASCGRDIALTLESCGFIKEEMKTGFRNWEVKRTKAGINFLITKKGKRYLKKYK